MPEDRHQDRMAECEKLTSGLIKSRAVGPAALRLGDTARMSRVEGNRICEGRRVEDRLGDIRDLYP